MAVALQACWWKDEGLVWRGFYVFVLERESSERVYIGMVK